MGWVRLDEVGKNFCCVGVEVLIRKSLKIHNCLVFHTPPSCLQYLLFKIISFEKDIDQKHEVSGTFSMSI